MEKGQDLLKKGERKSTLWTSPLLEVSYRTQLFMVLSISDSSVKLGEKLSQDRRN